MATFFLLAIDDATASSSSDTVLEEIQVTATRRAGSPREVPAAITLIPATEIRDIKLVTDALQTQPGVFLQQTTPGQGAAIVRGLKGSEVLHLVDGFRLNNAIFRNAPTPFLALVPLASVDRIEILRGAPASLYGNDAAGGVVQVVSRFPSFDGDAAELRRELHLALDTAERGLIMRGTLEYGTASVASLFGAEYLQTGDRRIGGGERVGPSAYESKAVRLALSVRPGEGRQWLFDLQLAEQPDTPRIDELVAGYGQTEPSSSEYYFRPNERRFAHLRYSAADGLGSADWIVDAGWQRIVDNPVTREFGSSLRNRESNSSDLTGITVSAARSMIGIAWLAGAEYYHDRVRSQRIEENIDTTAIQEIQSRYPDDSLARQAAFYLNANFRPGGRHSVTGGVRYSLVDVRLPASGTLPEAGVKLGDVSADAGWLFDVASNVQIVANFGRGFRAPNVFDLGALGNRPGNRYNIPSPGLQPEHVTQLDVGLRFQGADFTSELVFYQLRYTDRITSVLTGDVTGDGRDIIQSRNVSSANIDGVEVSAVADLSAQLTGGLMLNYSWGEQSEVGGGVVPADRIPPLNGHLKMSWRPAESWSFETSLQFAGRQDRLSPRDVRDVRMDPLGTAGWGSLNARAEWQPGGGWQLAVDLDNLFDQRYRMHGSGIDATGRNIQLSAARSW